MLVFRKRRGAYGVEYRLRVEGAGLQTGSFTILRKSDNENRIY